VPVKLEVFDVAGRLVRTLFRGQVQGDVVHEKTWDGLSNDGSLLPSGVYFVVLTVRDDKIADKVMLISGL
jgi:flagellar hook assembly protein FlgD